MTTMLITSEWVAVCCSVVVEELVGHGIPSRVFVSEAAMRLPAGVMLGCVAYIRTVLIRCAYNRLLL